MSFKVSTICGKEVSGISYIVDSRGVDSVTRNDGVTKKTGNFSRTLGNDPPTMGFKSSNIVYDP